VKKRFTGREEPPGRPPTGLGHGFFGGGRRMSMKESHRLIVFGAAGFFASGTGVLAELVSTGGSAIVGG